MLIWIVFMLDNDNYVNFRNTMEVEYVEIDKVLVNDYVRRNIEIWIGYYGLITI